MKVGKPSEFDALCIITFAILLQEFGSRSLTEHNEHLEFIVAIYLEFFDAVNKASMYPESWRVFRKINICLADQKELDNHLAKVCKELELSDYVHLQSLVSESLSNAELLGRHLLHIVHLAALLLREHPSRTFSFVLASSEIHPEVSDPSRLARPYPEIRDQMHIHLLRERSIRKRSYNFAIGSSGDGRPALFGSGMYGHGCVYGPQLDSLVASGVAFTGYGGHLDPLIKVSGPFYDTRPRY
jgi:hypothetical protein